MIVPLTSRHKAAAGEATYSECNVKFEKFRIKVNLSAGAKFKEEVDREIFAFRASARHLAGSLEQLTPKREPKIAFLLPLFFLLT